MAVQPPRPIRLAVLHKPGPKWKYGVDCRAQEGIGEHVQHYQRLHEQGKLQPGPPAREVRPWMTALEQG